MISRPKSSDCTDYYFTYIDQVPEGDIISTLENQLDETTQFLQGINEEKAMHRYAAGKWSMKEVIGHVIDTERVFAFRALCFARNDKSELPAMEQDDFVKFANFDTQAWQDLREELKHVRLANVFLFKSFDEEILSRKGMASGFEFTVRAFPWIIAGHERHHLRVLKECYLS